MVADFLSKVIEGVVYPNLLLTLLICDGDFVQACVLT